MPVRPDMAHQIATAIDHGDIHGLADLICLGFCCGDERRASFRLIMALFC
jgi:hypothetical protein